MLRKILLFDRNRAFCDDVESRMILDDYEQMDLVTGSRFDHISADIEKFQATELLINAQLIPTHPDWDFGIPVKCYGRTTEDLMLASQANIPCYGEVNTAKDLLKLVENDQTLNFQEGQRKQNYKSDAGNEPLQIKNEEYASENFKPRKTADATSEVMFEEPWKKDTAVHTPSKQQVDVFTGEPLQSRHPERSESPAPYVDRKVSAPQEKAEPAQVSQDFAKNDNFSNRYENPFQKPEPQKEEVKQPFDLRTRLAEKRAQEMEEERRRVSAQRKETNQYAVENAMGNIRHPAKVITVYSAKGGVGKTTIAAELATFLSLTNHGRGRFQVCIVDFNIDFGDVLNTLSFDPEKSCMTYWAADIQSRLEMGQDPKSIQYTEKQISVFLQKNEKDGLSALLAPLTNEDSMDITSTQISIMLDNLIRFGGFDFIICDTGNNTRDSSIISLERADEVLLIMTQDVNTANCNNSFLSTIYKVGFDMNKFRLVINKVRPAKEVAISAEELVEAFVNPLTGKNYTCLGKIDDDNSVKQANNLGEPLVYQSAHSFTKKIALIAKEIIGDTFVLSEPEKQGFFKKFKKKKKKQ